MRVRATLLLWLTISMTVAAGEGPPVDPDKARRANAAGMKLYRQQRWPEALHQFEEAVGWDPKLSPRTTTSPASRRCRGMTTPRSPSWAG